MANKLFHSILLLCAAFLLEVFAVDEVCADFGNAEFTCTNDVMGTRLRMDGRMLHVGVAQRVDGSESEIKAIREVMSRTDEYLLNEVLALPEYERVRNHW